MKKIKILDVEYFYIIKHNVGEYGHWYETKFYSTEETELKILSTIKHFFGIKKDNLEKQPKHLFSYFENIFLLYYLLSSIIIFYHIIHIIKKGPYLHSKTF